MLNNTKTLRMMVTLKTIAATTAPKARILKQSSLANP